VDFEALAKYWDKDKRLIRASNGQIVWDYSERGYFTMDTPAAQAVIGFGGGREHNLGDCVIRYDKPFANIYVAAKDRGQTLATARQWVILALARTQDKGAVIEETSMDPLVKAPAPEAKGRPEDRIADMLKNPTLLIEPVKATLTVKRAGPFKAYALDHDGCKPEKATEIPVAQAAGAQQITLDGAQYRTMYYVIEFE